MADIFHHLYWITITVGGQVFDQQAILSYTVHTRKYTCHICGLLQISWLQDSAVSLTLTDYPDTLLLVPSKIGCVVNEPRLDLALFWTRSKVFRLLTNSCPRRGTFIERSHLTTRHPVIVGLGLFSFLPYRSFFTNDTKSTSLYYLALLSQKAHRAVRALLPSTIRA